MGEKRDFSQFAGSAEKKEGKKSKREKGPANSSNGHHASVQAGLEDASPGSQKLLALASAFADVSSDPRALELFQSAAGKKGPKLVAGVQNALEPFSEPRSIEKPPALPINTTPNAKVAVPFNVTESSQADSANPVPLPPLTDPILSSATFTHPGVLATSESPRLSYERLEYLGDAYVECIASRLIYDRFPDAMSGRLSQIRESLVNNWTLAGFALEYGFDAKVRVPQDCNQRGKAGTKIYADVFEAYVAALILQSPRDGFATTEAWLSALWAPKLSQSSLVPDINMSAKQDLAKKVLSKGIKLDYRQAKDSERSATDKGKTNFFVDVYLTGWGYKNKRLGSGTGWGTGQAGCRAAMKALDNEVLMNEISAMKQDYDAKREAEKLAG